MSIKQKFNIIEKNVWYSYDFASFLWKFSMILADFFYFFIRLARMKRIQTDPVPKHWKKGLDMSILLFEVADLPAVPALGPLHQSLEGCHRRSHSRKGA